MSIEKGFIRIEDTEAGAQVPPEGNFVYARDTDKAFKSDGSTLTELAGGGVYTNEEAQDAVGSMIDSTLTYVDATPSLGVAVNGVGNTHIRDSAALSVIGRSANSSGDPADIVGVTVGHVLQVLSGPTVGFDSVETTFPSWMNKYNPNRPPSSLGTGGVSDEFIGGSTLTFGWGNQESSTATAARDGLVLYHPIDTTGYAVYWFTGPDGASTDWVFHARVSTDFMGTYNMAGIVVLMTGTEATPTLYKAARCYHDGSSTIAHAWGNTNYTASGTSFGTGKYTFSPDLYLSLNYTSSTKVLKVLASENGYIYSELGSEVQATHPTTSFGLLIGSISAGYPASAFFHFVRVRTDANRSDVGS